MRSASCRFIRHQLAVSPEASQRYFGRVKQNPMDFPATSVAAPEGDVYLCPMRCPPIRLNKAVGAMELASPPLRTELMINPHLLLHRTACIQKPDLPPKVRGVDGD